MLRRPAVLLRVEWGCLLAFGCLFGRRWLVTVSIIRFSHIAFDRMLGFGLKYPTYFSDTHLQHIA